MKFFEKLDSAWFKSRCEALYIGLDLTRREAVMFNSFFIARRLILAVLTSYFAWFPAL